MSFFLPSEIRAQFAAATSDAEVVLVHSAPRAIGNVVGGIDSIVEALVDALGSRCTLVVPTFTTDICDPSSFRTPPAPRRQWEKIRAEVPFFDPARSTPRGMGRIADLVWRRAEARRSFHPHESIAALGPRARELVEPHPLDDPMGTRSPWARMVALDATILMIGVGLERCTMIHHVEQLADVPYLPIAAYVIPVCIEAERHWVEVEAGGDCSHGFPTLEPLLRARGAIRDVHIGEARSMIVSARALFALASARLSEDDTALLCDRADCELCVPGRAACEAARAAPGTAGARITGKTS